MSDISYLPLGMQCDLIMADIDIALLLNRMEMQQVPQMPKLGTAKANALLWDEVWCTPKQWKRATKRLHKLNI